MSKKVFLLETLRMWGACQILSEGAGIETNSMMEFRTHEGIIKLLEVYIANPANNVSPEEYHFIDIPDDVDDIFVWEDTNERENCVYTKDGKIYPIWVHRID